MSNIDRNDIKVRKGAKIKDKEILKIMHIVISEDEADQYMVLNEDGDKILITKEELEEIKE